VFQRHLLDVSEQRLLEEQLREAQKFQALGKLTTGVAHDFNNVLAVITGYAARLESLLPESTHRESAAAIGAAADRGTALVRRLLSFSRPQSSARRTVDLNTLVIELLPLLRSLIGDEIELELAFEPRPLPVEVDPTGIDQVLMNLVINARDAMPNGGRLTISTAAVDADAAVTVSDTGIGI
jgi:two-component system cell cycle sensor histidine kinase/response regulator CckA